MLTEAMIDARVEDAIRQHQQKMDWLHREEAESVGKAGVIRPPGGALDKGGKNMGFVLQEEIPQAHKVDGTGQMAGQDGLTPAAWFGSKTVMGGTLPPDVTPLPKDSVSLPAEDPTPKTEGHMIKTEAPSKDGTPV